MGNPTACVTGATGYVASELIRQLLSRGYAVKATVRCAPESPRLQYLRNLAAKSDGSLELVQVPDLEKPSDALEKALQGASYVFHVASPFRFDGEVAVWLFGWWGSWLGQCNVHAAQGLCLSHQQHQWISSWCSCHKQLPCASSRCSSPGPVDSQCPCC